VTSVVSFLAAWFLAHRVKWIEKYHTPVVVGSAIAAIQSIIQLYLPTLGWVIADATPEIAAATTTAQNQLAAQSQAAMLQPTDEDPNEFTYNDAFDAGRYGVSSGGKVTNAGPQASPPAQGDLSDLAIDDAIGAANLGVFATN